MLSLSDSPDSIPGVGDVLLKRLHTLGVYSIRDLLFYFPFRYEVYSDIQSGSFREGDLVSLSGILQSIDTIHTRNGKRLTKALFFCEGKLISAVWFNQPYLKNSLHVGDAFRLSGKVGKFGGLTTLMSPQRDKIISGKTEHPTISRPEVTAHEPIGIYGETAGITSKKIRELVIYAWNHLESQITEYIPRSYLSKYNYVHVHEAVRIFHFPKNLEEVDIARSRFSYEEMLVSQLRSSFLRSHWQEQALAFRLDIALHSVEIDQAIASLPFSLTEAQRRSLDEIIEDMSRNVPMNRLLEGDVGSGKTVVAALAMYAAFLEGHKSLLMAPTQILATQHYETIKKVLEKFNVSVALVVSGMKNSQKSADVYVGTHALLHQKENLENVALTIIDEQHRFGVEQRARLRTKHGTTHVLSMTATPIPRTLALTLYGDLDLSVIDQMPVGRKPIKTRVVTQSKREDAYQWIRTFIKEKGEQVFVVCPFVEPSESSETIKSATVEYDRLSKEVFPDFSVGLLHGKMKSSEKDIVLDDFRNKKYQILVCTPVVEVGIDIHNASIILIESAERFGLAQLHQFRGRVGRGGQQAFCLLFTSEEHAEDSHRLRSLEDTNSGIELAEIDLKYRGSGNIFGQQQSGRLFFKFADLFNTELLHAAKRDALELLSSDSELKGYPYLRDKVAGGINYIDAN